MFLELGNSRCYFAFARSVCIKFIQGNYFSSYSQTMTLSYRLPHVQSGKLSHSRRGKLEQLISQYPDVLIEKLGLTHLMEYEIQLLENTPVRLAPHRLAPPKIQYSRQHIKKLLRNCAIEPSLSNYCSPMFLVPKPGGAYRACCR